MDAVRKVIKQEEENKVIEKLGDLERNLNREKTKYQDLITSNDLKINKLLDDKKIETEKLIKTHLEAISIKEKEIDELMGIKIELDKENKEEKIILFVDEILILFYQFNFRIFVLL